jgi:hypothetical protein
MPGIVDGILAGSELHSGEALPQRTGGSGRAPMLVGALPLRLVEKDISPADRAELEWGIEHGYTPVARWIDCAGALPM